MPKRESRRGVLVHASTQPSAYKSKPPVNFPYPVQEDKLSGCQASFVMVDNNAHPLYTKLTLEVNDYPGLLRIVAWVLNGLGVRVEHGLLKTESDSSTANDIFWLTNFQGRKLSDSSARNLSERLQDFVVVCAPQTEQQNSQKQEWTYGNIQISNAAHPQYTQIVVRGEPNSSKPGFLLEVASVLSSIGAQIHEAVILGGPDSPVTTEESATEHDYSLGRYFRFWLTDFTGQKMDSSRVSALIFTLDLVRGQGHMPIVAPNMDAFLGN